MKPFYLNGEFKGSIETDAKNGCLHELAKPTGKSCADGCCDYYFCPTCKRTILVEVPD